MADIDAIYDLIGQIEVVDGTPYTIVDPVVTPTSKNPVQSKGIYDFVRSQLRNAVDGEARADIADLMIEVNKLDQEIQGKMEFYKIDYANNLLSHDGVVLTYSDIIAKYNDPKYFIYVEGDGYTYIPTLPPLEGDEIIEFSSTYLYGGHAYTSRVIINSNNQIKHEEIQLLRADEAPAGGVTKEYVDQQDAALQTQIDDELAEIRELSDNAVLKNGTDMVTVLNTEYINKNIQYFDINKVELHHFWNNSGQSNYTPAAYSAHAPIYLKAGDYYLFYFSGGNFYKDFASFIQPVGGTLSLLNNYIVSTVWPVYHIHIDTDSILYLTMAYSEASTFNLSDYCVCNVNFKPNTYTVGVFGSFTMPNLQLTQAQTSPANVIHVAKDGSGDYDDIQTAIDNAHDSDTNQVTIYIGAGVYDKFSMTDALNKLRYINLIGESELTTIVKSDTGNYSTPAAEIRTNGIVKHIQFVQETSTETFVPGGTFNYSYAVHDDMGACSVIYENCIFFSNAGPAVGLGTNQDKNMIFRHCIFTSTADGTFGSKDLGAFFAHTQNTSTTVITNQNLTIDSCMFDMQFSSKSAQFSMLTTSTGSSQRLLIMNSGFNANNGTHGVKFQGEGWLDSKSFNNNYVEL